MRNSKGFTLIELIIIVAIIGILSAVSIPYFSNKDDIKGQNADKIQTEQTNEAMAEANKQIGMPAITNFQERKLAKMIFELRDKENLICYAYIVNQMQGRLVFIGKCIGFGLPYSVQYTNPMRVLDADKECDGYFSTGADAFTVPQADPNGLFMPSGLSATWLMMIDPETNEARPVYIEPEIVVSPFKLH